MFSQCLVIPGASHYVGLARSVFDTRSDALLQLPQLHVYEPQLMKRVLDAQQSSDKGDDHDFAFTLSFVILSQSEGLNCASSVSL